MLLCLFRFLLAGIDTPVALLELLRKECAFFCPDYRQQIGFIVLVEELLGGRVCFSG